MTELFTTLTAVITKHGLGDAGWKSARWEVYDMYSKCFQELEYSTSSWDDDAKDWLMGRMQLISNCITTRQDNKLEVGKLYNKMLPTFQPGAGDGYNHSVNIFLTVVKKGSKINL
ncbi:hypothetical protein C8J57DRAFT_1257307 [Mycena rebaudengoi]|nr:hypothetical protein C8J57DRAFT_1257307 [Mycena rebaudengoi]